MPIFAIIAHDRKDAGGLRADTRERHLAHLSGLGDALLRAGPLLDEAGTPYGSVIFVEAADLASARALADADPYAKAGLFNTVEVAAWRQVLP